MKRTLAAGTLLATALWAASVDPHRVKRATMAALEKVFDTRIQRASAVEPLDLMGNTRGIYLQGYGAVFTTAVNLIISPTINPFHMTFTKAEIDRVHARKVERLPLLKQQMREMLFTGAAALDGVPLHEQIVVGVSLMYFSWEDTTGLPAQLVMQGERQKLLNRAAAETAIHMEEY
jgi:hypothetical protein